MIRAALLAFCLCSWLLVESHRCAGHMQLPLRHTFTSYVVAVAEVADDTPLRLSSPQLLLAAVLFCVNFARPATHDTDGESVLYGLEYLSIVCGSSGTFCRTRFAQGKRSRIV